MLTNVEMRREERRQGEKTPKRQCKGGRPGVKYHAGKIVICALGKADN